MSKHPTKSSFPSPVDARMDAAIQANVKLQADRAKPGSSKPVVDPHELGPVSMDEGVEDETNGNEWDEALHGPRLTFDAATETLSTFLARINEAKLNGDEFIETNQRIFDYYTKKKPTPYLMYDGIKVYVIGTRAEIEREESMSIDDRLTRERQRAQKHKELQESKPKGATA